MDSGLETYTLHDQTVPTKFFLPPFPTNPSIIRKKRTIIFRELKHAGTEMRQTDQMKKINCFCSLRPRYANYKYTVYLLTDLTKYRSRKVRKTRYFTVRC